MAKKKSFVVATKDTSDGSIRQGKVLGKFRSLEFAQHAFFKLAARECGFAQTWHCGIFCDGKLVD